EPLPAYPPVVGLDLPEVIASERVGLDLTLRSAVPVVSLASATHDLTLTDADGAVAAKLAGGRVVDNRDLVVRYVLGADDVTGGALAHEDARGRFVSLTIEPPNAPSTVDAMPRELVFVLDTSGSMNGLPLEASKRFMTAALKGLRPDDHFRIIRFSTGTSDFSADPVVASAANVRRALAYVRGLSAGGGTEIDNAIRTAFATRRPEGTLRLVVFLSDGYIGNEAAVLKTVRRQIGDARLYAFGIGTAVNRYLLSAMAAEGRGIARTVDPSEDAHEAATAFAADFATPILTDIAINWGDLAVTEMTPARIPDLFAGRALRVMARYEGPPGPVAVTGMMGGAPARLSIAVPAPASDAPALPLVFARSRIADHERALAVGDVDKDQAREAITALGLNYGLQSRFTSFVATSTRVVNESGESRIAKVPLPMPAGVSATTYPTTPGASTPEPTHLLGLIVLGLMLTIALKTARRCRRC
ncbi:MAG: VWA domain-containing protein, partial [Pseudomonadota bacterium]